VLAGACGAGEEASTGETELPPPPVTGGPAEEALALLPDLPALRIQILFGDLERLRAAYPEASGYREALAGLLLSDAVVGAAGPLWRKTYGFGLGTVDTYIAGGVHPREAMVAQGRFSPNRVEATLKASGYRERGDALRRGADGSIDESTAVGRLARSSLNRVAVTSDRIVAASTTALFRATLSPKSTFAEDADRTLAARALGDVTGAVIAPPEAVGRPEGVEVIAGEPAVIIAAGLDDQGPEARMVKIVLVYEDAAAARADAEAFRAKLPEAPVSGEDAGTFGDLIGELSVDIVEERAVLISGVLPADQSAGAWRDLLASGALALLLVPQETGG
jgi:hypothetical protein